MSVLRAGAWTAASRVLAQASQFIVFLVAVRLLSAAEFGVFAVVAAWTVILSQFSLAGWPEFVMQWAGTTRRLRQVLAVCLFVGTGFAALGVVAAHVLPYDDDATLRLMWVLALWIPVVSLGATYAGILNLQDRLVPAAIAASLGEVANLAVSIAALLNGDGVLALAYGRLAGGLVWLLAVFALVRLWPDPRMTLAEFLGVFRFSSRIIAVRLLLNLRLYAGTLVIGFYLGAADAGYFRAAQRLVGALSEVLGEPTRVLAWSLFRAARNAASGPQVDFRDTANRFFSALLVVAVPLFAVLALLAEDLVAVVLGPEWAPAVPVVRILAIAYALYASGAATEAILSLAGRIGLLPWLVAAYAVIGVAMTVIAAHWGLEATAWAQVAAAAVIFVTTMVVQFHAARIRWVEIMARIWAMPVALAVALGLAWGFNGLGPLQDWPAALRLVLSSVVALVVYSGVLMVVDRRFLRLILDRRRGD